MVQPQSVVYHIGGGTLPKSSALKTYLNFRNNFSLLYKNIESNKLLQTFVIRLFMDGIAGIKFLIEGHPADFWAVFKAHFYFYKNWSKLKRKRKSLPHKKTNCMYEGSIVFDHYLLRKKKFSQLNRQKIK